MLSSQLQTYLNILHSCVKLNFGIICFQMKLQLGDTALRIEVNHGAVNLSSSSEALLHGCLQEHIAKLQVKWMRVC